MKIKNAKFSGQIISEKVSDYKDEVSQQVIRRRVANVVQLEDDGEEVIKVLIPEDFKYEKGISYEFTVDINYWSFNGKTGLSIKAV